MKPVDFDNTRRHLWIMLRGQELSESQAAELCDIITERVDFSRYVKLSPLPPSITISNASTEVAGHMPDGVLENIANRIESDRTGSVMFPGEPMTATEARILQDSRPAKEISRMMRGALGPEFPPIQVDPTLPSGTT